MGVAIPKLREAPAEGARAPWLGGGSALTVVIAAYLFSTALCFGVIDQVDIDTGRDYIVPNLLLQGRVLYREIVHQFGPLAPWVHYLLFRVFGPGTMVLLLAGSLAGLIIVILTFLLAKQILPQSAALVASLVVIAHSVYAPNNMSYATPYTFSAVYGLLFSLLALYSALRSLDRADTRWCFVAGAAAALAVASKHEFAVISLFILLASWVFRWSRLGRRSLPGLLASAGACIAITGAFAALLLRKITAAELIAVAYPKPYLQALEYYYENVQSRGPHAWAGFRETVFGFLLNFGFILTLTCLIAVALGLASGERPSRKLMATLALLGLPLLYAHRYLGYYPLLLHAFVLAWAAAGPIKESRRQVAFLTICAAVFFFRVWPAPKLSGYPYPLLYYIPSLIVFLYLCYRVATPGLGRFLPEKRVCAAMTAVFVSCFVAYPFLRMTYPWSRRAERLVTRHGMLLGRPPQVSKAKVLLEEIGRRTSPGDTILLIPFSTIFYFLSDRPPASKYIEYGYGLLIDGKDEVDEIEALRRKPPQLVVIDDIHQTLKFPGPVDTFGKAYNRQLSRWLWSNYTEVQTVALDGRPVHFLVPNGVGPPEPVAARADR